MNRESSLSETKNSGIITGMVKSFSLGGAPTYRAKPCRVVVFGSNEIDNALFK